MKQYIFSAVCLMSGVLCMSSCNEDKQAKPYTPDYEIVPEYTIYEKENYTISHDLFFICSFIRSSETNLHGLLP